MILATSRTDSVIGRIRFLIISINTMIGIRKTGDPMGTIWVSILLVFLIEKYIIFVIHITIRIGRTIDIWAVIINDVGIIAIRLNAKIAKKSGIKKLLLIFLFVSVLNSFLKTFFTRRIIELILDIKINIGEIIIIIGIIHPILK